MLDRVFAYKENDSGRWYLRLTYIYEDEKGKHKVIYPKVGIPLDQFGLPNITTVVNDYDPWLRQTAILKIEPVADFELFEASTEDPRNGEKLEGGLYYDILVKPKTHKMTLEEIEKELGYKVEIVSGK